MAEKRKAEYDVAGEDPVISLQDIIDEDAELETTANAVLGGSNDQECTYSDGYLARQALYACSTCETTSDTGVCLACSLECHEGHDLYELYTKRNFRCDCGNSKFSHTKCNLHPVKDPENEKNTYNHNFKGTYCTCQRPYPDPEDDIDDEMIQCVVCEDWFHSRHLKGQGVPDSFGYAEMICHLCMSGEAKILWYYNWEFTPHETSVVEVDDIPERCDEDRVEKGKRDSDELQVECCADGELPNASAKTPLPQKVSDRNVSNEATLGEKVDESLVAEVKTTGNCTLARLIKTYETCQFPDSASFWPESWREKLCECPQCFAKMKNLSFLYNGSDTVAEYERKGVAECPESSMSSGMRALGGMNRIQQVEVIQGYNDMKAKLSEFLKSFAQESRVVTEEDIRNFFRRMSESKRLKVDIPHSCK